jgi:hypothetical protein
LAGVLEVIVEYLNTRSAFGRKIGSYQSLKHSCADILVGLERTRSHVNHAASLLAVGEDAEVALRMAKVEAGDSFVFAGDRRSSTCAARFGCNMPLGMRPIIGDGSPSSCFRPASSGRSSQLGGNGRMTTSASGNLAQLSHS